MAITPDIRQCGRQGGSKFTPKFLSVKWGIIPPKTPFCPYIRGDTWGEEGGYRPQHSPRGRGVWGLL